MFGAYITVGIFILAVLFLLFAVIYPRITKRRFVLKWEAPRKKRRAHAKPKRRKRKSVWIKLI